MSRHSLQPGYRLHWYVLREILGQGGFGITYLADDTNLNQRVAIKEYLPTELAVRENDDSVHPVSGEHGDQFKWGLDRFIQEAQTLAQFKHHNIVRVLTVFTDNNTAYMVMEYEEGRALHDVLKERKTLPEDEQIRILTPLLDGLEKVHAMGFIHRDIKPANIYIRADGSPVLLDFGSARQALGHQTRTLTTMVSPGFAPFEQYVSKSDKQGPWTDIYGIGATLYRASIGRSPPNAVDRSESILHNGQDLLVPAVRVKPDGYSEQFLQSVDHALAFKGEDRPQSIGEWRRDFTGLLPGTTMPGDAVETVVNIAPDTVSADAPVTAKTFEAGATAVTAPAPARPSWFRRLSGWIKKILKWGAILFAVRVLLSLCKDRPQQSGDAKKDQAGEAPSAPVEAPAAPAMLPTEPPSDTALIDELLAAAADDIDALRLTSPVGNNAVEKYHRILNLDADNPAAQYGLGEVAGKYLELMDGAIVKREFQRAQHYLDKAASVDPDHPGLEDARARLRSARAVAETPPPVDSDRPDRDTATPADQSPVTPPPSGLMTEYERRAIERVKEALHKNPDDKDAQRMARRLAKNFERKVKQAIESGEFARAEAYVREAMELAPNNRGLRDALEKILEVRRQTGL